MTDENEHDRARQILNKRGENLEKARYEKFMKEHQGKAQEAAEAERDAVVPPPPAPRGANRARPDLDPLIDRHEERLTRQMIEDVVNTRQQTAENQHRLAEFERTHDTRGMTACQLAREGLEPLPEVKPHPTYREPAREFNADAKKREGLDHDRLTIEHEGSRGPDGIGLAQGAGPERAHGERQRTAEQEADRQRVREQVAREMRERIERDRELGRIPGR